MPRRCGGDSRMSDARERDVRDSSPPVGEGAVLYDTRDPDRRPCCSEGGRCLFHVTEVWTDTDGFVMYEVWDGTHTVREYVHKGDLKWMFEPAGWSWPVGMKPTYHLTRQCEVYDSHDRMLEANR
jgi:hypothetical protein